MMNSGALPERSLPLYEQTYHFLRTAIAEGRYRPGAKLVESTLARDLRVSRTPVREAIKQLVREGFLFVSASGGVRVRRPSTEDVAEIFAMRAMLEGSAAALAARHRPAEDLQAMEAALARARRAESAGDLRTLVQANTTFHSRLVIASGSRRLAEVNAGFETWTVFYRSNSLQDPVQTALSLAEHEAIMSAIRWGDSDDAEHVVRRHVLHGGWRVVSKLSKLPDGRGTGNPLFDHMAAKYDLIQFPEGESEDGHPCSL